MSPFRLFLLALPLLLTACGLSPQQKADYARVQDAGVSPAIYDKMIHGDPLSVGDVIRLSHAGVGSHVILRYLHQHPAIYYLSSRDVHRLQRAGVNPRVINFLLFTSEGTWWSPGPYPFFGANPFSPGPAYYGGYWSGFYYGGYGWGHHP